MDNKKTRTGLRMAMAGVLLATAVAQAQMPMVTPNANSQLKNKKVLVVAGNSSGGHAGARDNTLANLKAMATSVGFQLTEGDPLKFTDAYLAPYDVLVFNYFFKTEQAGTFPDPAKTAFINWLKKGHKGWVGYHTAGANQWNNGGDQAEWLWYQENVTLMRYDLHGSGTPDGNVSITTDPAVLSLPIMDGLKTNFKSFVAKDEWYNYEAKSRIFDTSTHTKFMYYLDNATKIDRFPANPNHPVAWFREDAQGDRYFYSTFEHDPDQVNSSWCKSILLRALEYVSGYGTTSITEPNGKAVIANKGMSYLMSSRKLQIDQAGAYRLSIWSPQGQKLYSTQGSGQMTYSPAAFQKPGVYFVKLESKAGKFTQRVMIY